MGKATYKGPVPKDDPMFSSGHEFFVRPGAEPISKTASTQQLPIELPPDATWHTIFEGSGSLSGNSWYEEVCYLGQESWCLSICDDPAFSSEDLSEESTEQHSSSTLVAWCFEMDEADNEGFSRLESLAVVAAEVGATECVELIQDLLKRKKG